MITLEDAVSKSNIVDDGIREVIKKTEQKLDSLIPKNIYYRKENNSIIETNYFELYLYKNAWEESKYSHNIGINIGMGDFNYKILKKELKNLLKKYKKEGFILRLKTLSLIRGFKIEFLRVNKKKVKKSTM